jgi:hypothetical protein
MTNNSDGLSPTLRPQLGVGFNRALPASFGFDKGLFPDGVDDYLVTKNGGILPLVGAFEFWAINSTGRFSFKFVNSNTSESFGINIYPNNGGATILGNLNGFLSNPSTAIASLSCIGLGHFVVNYDFRGGEINFSQYQNGVLILSNIFGTATLEQSDYTAIQIGSTDLGTFNFPIDELRFYNKMLSQSEIILNYNNGVGNNPCVTEFLKLWYKFEKFENLDFSQLQDNSDIILGLKDLSGNNNHAQPINMDTDPLSIDYVIKPF